MEFLKKVLLFATGLFLGFSGIAYAATAGIPISVPSAGSSGFLLQSDTNGRYNAISVTAGSNVTISTTTSNITISSTGGGSGTFAWTPTTYNSVNVNATSTGLWLKATSPFSLIASSTFATNASSTLSTVNMLWINSITSALPLVGSDHSVSAYAGGSCTNQFIRSLSAAGGLTCATVSLTADVSGILPLANGGTNASSFTTSNSVVGYDGTRLITAPLTSAFTFPYASTTVTSATRLCLSTDCRTSWPTGTGTGLATTSPINNNDVLVYSSNGAGSAYGVSTSTLYGGTGTGGQVVGWSNVTGGLTLIATSSAGGAGTPGGSDTQIQFNDASSFGGAVAFVWDKARTMLGIGTTTPRSAKVTIATSTAPQLTLTGTGANQYSFREAGGNLYISTTSPSTFATTTTPLFFFDATNEGAQAYNAIAATATTTLNTNFNTMNALWVEKTGTTTISNLNTGALKFDTDAGVITAMDLPIVSASSNTPESYSFDIAASSTPNLTIYGLSDGSGGVKRQGVGVGTTTPAWGLSVDMPGSGSSTSTIANGSSTHPSCFQLWSPNGTAYQLYVDNSGTLVSVAGSCPTR